MLKLFEQSTVFQVVVILVVTMLLWFPQMADPQPMAAPVGFAPLYEVLYNCAFSPMLAVVIAIVLVIAGGVMLNLLLANTGLISQNSLLPTLFYILFMSATAETLSATLIVGLLIIAFVRLLLLHSTLLTISRDKVFGATALIGICSLFYLPSLSLLVSYLLVAMGYRLYNWRDWMVLLLGLLAPYLLLWTILYMTGGLEESFMALKATLTPSAHWQLPSFDIAVAAHAVLLLFFAVSLFVLLSRFKEKTTLWQKNTLAVVMPTVAALVVALYEPTAQVNLQLCAVPFALCASSRFGSSTRYKGGSRPRRPWRSHLKDLLFVIVIAAAVIC